jgi:hypothetical protein
MIVAMQPAAKELSAARASADPALPARAMALPSMIVTIELASPGIRTRIAVVDPPYCAP